MRFVLIFTAVLLTGLTALQYVGEPPARSPFRDNRVVVLAGGREEDVFLREVSRGAFQAARDLGCEVEVLRTQWNTQEEIGVFQQVMAGVPDAICVVGSSEIDRLRPMIDDAIQEGISITSYYRRAPSVQATHGELGFGYAGPNAEAAAEELLRTAVEKHGLGAGERIAILADPRLESGGDLLEALRRSATSLGLSPELVEMRVSDFASPSPLLNNYFSTGAADGTLPRVVLNLDGRLVDCIYAITQADIPPERLILLGVEFDEQSAPHFFNSSPHLSLLLMQNLPAQAYMAVVQACISSTYSAAGATVHVPYRIIGPGAPVAPAPPDSPVFIQQI